MTNFWIATLIVITIFPAIGNGLTASGNKHVEATITFTATVVSTMEMVVDVQDVPNGHIVSVLATVTHSPIMDNGTQSETYFVRHLKDATGDVYVSMAGGYLVVEFPDNVVARRLPNSGNDNLQLARR